MVLNNRKMTNHPPSPDSGSVVGDEGAGMFSMLAAVFEQVIERVWGRLEAMGGKGWARNGSELEGGTPTSFMIM